MALQSNQTLANLAISTTNHNKIHASSHRLQVKWNTMSATLKRYPLTVQPLTSHIDDLDINSQICRYSQL